MTGRRATAYQAVVLVVLAIMGTVAGIYVLAHQSGGIRSPWTHTYRIRAQLTAADGVRPGIGAPVNVAGVRVGQIVGLEGTPSGTASVTLEIERDTLPHVYADARVHLEPLSPLKDMSVDLYPGAPPKPQLGDDATIDLAHTAPPVELSTLLGALDVDTRAALTSFVTASGEGTAGQGSALRRALVAMGPTTRQVRRLVDALQGRRQELSRFVTNLARVTRAASRDRRLATVVAAGHTTLAAVARQDAALGTALSRLPSSLRTTQQTLELTASFSRELRPAVEALQPAVGRLPKTFAQIRTLATAMRSTVDAEVRPLVRAARPLAEDLSPTIPALARLSPHVTHALQTATYVLNELAYNPPGDDEGGLFWMSWFFHNWRSFVSVGDAHGTIIRGIPFISCQSVEGPAQEVTALVHTLFNLPTLCPR